MNQIANQILFLNIQMRKNRENPHLVKEMYNKLLCLKMIDDMGEFDETFEKVYASGFSNVCLECNLYPNKFTDIGYYREIACSEDVAKELRWQLKILSKNINIINDFLSRRQEIDELIFCERFEEADNKLVEIEKKYGTSMWLLEEKVCVLNNMKKDAKELISDMKRNVVTSIIDFFIMRSSLEVSFADYSYFVQRELSKFLRFHPESQGPAAVYQYMLAPYAFELTDDNIYYILKFMRDLPLFDRYLCLIDLCEYICARSKNVEYKDCLKRCTGYLAGIEDPTIAVLCAMLGELDAKARTIVCEDPLLEIKNDFISGRLEECYEKLLLFMKGNTFNIQAYNMMVEVLQLTGKDIDETDIDNVGKHFIKHLESVYAIDKCYYDSLDIIRKKVISCVHSWWARDVYNSIIRRGQSIENNEYVSAVMYSNLQCLSVETICENVACGEAIKFLDDICERNDYIEFWYANLKGDIEKAVEICQVQDIKNLLLNDVTSRFEHYEKFLHSEKVCAVMKNRFAQKMWSSISTNQEMEVGIDYFLNIFVEQEDYVMVAPVDKFVNYLKCSGGIDKGDLRVPILYYINSVYFNDSFKDSLTIACEDFFDINGIERPSQMGHYMSEESSNKLIYFLKNVCIPRIIGPVLLSIRTDKELDQERIDTCQLLRQIDPLNEDLYEAEIMELTRKLFINEGLMSIESNKIHVNTDGLKAKLMKNLRSEFNSFLFYRNHRIDSFLKKIKDMEGGEAIQIITVDESQMFNEIVYKIRNEFVSGGEYSLDGYLSINIRHGILDGQLRSPLAKYDLLATYHVEDDEYEVSNRWLYPIKNSSTKEMVKKAIIEFNKEMEEIIRHWRSELIQVSTEEKPSKGIFDYSLRESDIAMLQTYLTEKITLDEFIDILFDYLWRVTETNLQKMKNVISEVISVQITEAFNRLTDVYRTVTESVRFPDAMRWLGSVKNDMDEELDKISNWFCRSAESQQADFDIEYAMQIGFKMIQSIHPEKNFELHLVNNESTKKIPGKYLKCFWDIFYTQFDNISKYALPIEDVIFIDCELAANETYVYVKITNDYDCSHGIEKEKEKISSAEKLIADKKYLAKAKQEGGSGIPKIYKIMSSDLNMRTEVKCQFIEEENKFFIEIKGEHR